MCGIVGIFDCVGKRAVVPAVLERMNERQHHRGPDGGGVHIEPGVGLVRAFTVDGHATPLLLRLAVRRPD